MNKYQKILISALIIIACLTIYITGIVIYKVYNFSNKQNIINNITEMSQEEFIIKDKPYKLNDTNDNIKVYNGYQSYDINYSDMGYITPQFKFLNLKVNGWVLKEEYQKILYDKCLKYNINYIKALSIIYKENSRNNPYAIHHNSDGSIDIGIAQFNSKNTDILKKITGSTDIEWLKNPEINIECAVYLMWRNENCYEDVESLYDTIVMYNGGYGSMRNIKDNKYTLNCPASLYAANVIWIMNELYSYYMNVPV